MEIYNVERSGELSQVGNKLSDVMNTEDVLLVVIDDIKKIFLWKGINSPVAKKFIGARCGQQLRGEKGLLFKVIPIDEGEEPEEFEKFKEVEPSKVKGVVAKPGEVPIATPTLTDDLKETLLSEELEEGFKREGIIIAKDYYAVTESTANVLGKQVTNQEIQKAEDLPDGLLFDVDYGIRIHVDPNGKVDSVEILKKKE
ncbi:MAG: hypothetical protein EU549_05335 [Promethearchaeota archaeon]|nr:MAG: hypothetical protein EU549_05335 [Candidatus Lokiarchaeota archaeon]